ncbi:unnamed protein product [Closterium sp. Naga37s-1]|nr:unnamed protein product [Closterium sp. Naga37s-1]
MAALSSQREGGGASSQRETVRLFSAWFCPFAQRAWIALEAKGVKYEYVEVDPYAKPAELMAVNPRGLVPALLHITQHGEQQGEQQQQQRCLYESSVIMEYIDEAFPPSPLAAAAAAAAPGSTGVHLMPRDAYERAQVRMWMDFVNRKIVPTFYRYLQKQSREEQEAERAALISCYEQLGAAMETISPEGSFFLGQQFSLMDISLAPWVLRHDILRFYRNFSLPSHDEASPALRRFWLWETAIGAHPSVSATLADRDSLREIYKRYADNTATSEVAVAINKGTALP